MRRYCRISTLLDVRLIVAQQRSRQALTTQEMNESQAAIKHFKEQQKELENCWKQTRWAYDMISAARSKTSECGIKLGSILFCDHPRIDEEEANVADDPVYAVPYIEDNSSPPSPPHSHQSSTASPTFSHRLRTSNKERWTPLAVGGSPRPSLSSPTTIPSSPVAPSSQSTKSALAMSPSPTTPSPPYIDDPDAIVAGSPNIVPVTPLLTDSVNVKLQPIALQQPLYSQPPEVDSTPPSPFPIASPFEVPSHQPYPSPTELESRLHSNFASHRHPVASSPIGPPRPSTTDVEAAQRRHASPPPRFFFPPPPSTSPTASLISQVPGIPRREGREEEEEQDAAAVPTSHHVEEIERGSVVSSRRTTAESLISIPPPPDFGDVDSIDGGYAPSLSSQCSTIDDPSMPDVGRMDAEISGTSDLCLGKYFKTGGSLIRKIHPIDARADGQEEDPSTNHVRVSATSSSSSYKGHYRPKIVGNHHPSLAHHATHSFIGAHHLSKLQPLPIPYSSSSQFCSNYAPPPHHLHLLSTTSTNAQTRLPQKDSTDLTTGEGRSTASIDTTGVSGYYHSSDHHRVRKNVGQMEASSAMSSSSHPASATLSSSTAPSSTPSVSLSAIAAAYSAGAGSPPPIQDLKSVDAYVSGATADMSSSVSAALSSSVRYIACSTASYPASSSSTPYGKSSIDVVAGDSVSLAPSSVSSTASTPMNSKKQLPTSHDLPQRRKIGVHGSGSSSSSSASSQRSSLSSFARSHGDPSQLLLCPPPSPPQPPQHNSFMMGSDRTKPPSTYQLIHLQQQQQQASQQQQAPQQQQPLNVVRASETTETALHSARPYRQSSFSKCQPVRLNRLSSLKMTTSASAVSASSSHFDAPNATMSNQNESRHHYHHHRNNFKVEYVSKVSVSSTPSPVIVENKNGFVTNTRVVHHDDIDVVSSRSSSRSSSSFPGGRGGGGGGRGLIKESEDGKSKGEDSVFSPPVSPTISSSPVDSLNVFAAYYHGLPPGQRTTVGVRANSLVEDVCRSVVKHFNKMVILKGSGTPVYIDEEFHVRWLNGEIKGGAFLVYDDKDD